VINGASDLLGAALGDAGKHARAAVSAASLPLGVAVEIEGIFQIA
jgi:enamine deaminase RidA (YjgF/YER057c/UK114 family)